MTLLESYITKFMDEDNQRYAIYFKIEYIESEEKYRMQFKEHFDSLDEFYSRLTNLFDNWNFRQLQFIPMLNKNAIPPSNPIDENELRGLEQKCRDSLPCEVISRPYEVRAGNVRYCSPG
jgi:hypothetical protein